MNYDAFTSCCVCNTPVDTREVSDGGSPDGCQRADGKWVCSQECDSEAHIAELEARALVAEAQVVALRDALNPLFVSDNPVMQGMPWDDMPNDYIISTHLRLGKWRVARQALANPAATADTYTARVRAEALKEAENIADKVAMISFGAGKVAAAIRALKGGAV